MYYLLYKLCMVYDDPSVTVAITSYNEEEYISEAIESAINQSRPPDKILISDDGSTDNSSLVLRKYMDNESIDVYLHEENSGLPWNRNFLSKKANSDLICHLDGDDRLMKHKLEREIQLYQQSSANIIFSNVRYIDESGSSIGRWIEPGTNPPTGEILAECAARDFPKSGAFRCALMETEIPKKLGYDNSLPIYVDWDFRIRACAKNTTAYVDEILSEYRCHDAGISTKSSREFHSKFVKHIQQKNEELLKDELTSERYEWVRQQIKDDLLRLSVKIHAENNNTTGAIRQYLHYLRQNYLTIRTYKLLTYILLSNGQFNYIQSRYHQWFK